MRVKKLSGQKEKPRKIRAAMTPEARENQLISLAYDLVEQRLLDGTATSQETTHFLKLGSTKEKKERELLDKQIELMSAKTETLQSSKRVEELYDKAISALKSYAGKEETTDDDTDVL